MTAIEFDPTNPRTRFLDGRPLDVVGILRVLALEVRKEALPEWTVSPPRQPHPIDDLLTAAGHAAEVCRAWPVSPPARRAFRPAKQDFGVPREATRHAEAMAVPSSIAWVAGKARPASSVRSPT